MVKIMVPNPMNKWMIWGYHYYFWKHPHARDLSDLSYWRCDFRVVDLARKIKPPNPGFTHQDLDPAIGTICGGLFPNMFFKDKSATLDFLKG